MQLKLLQLLGFGIGGMIVAIICNILLLRFSKSLGIRNNNNVVIRWSNESKPSLGGVSFYVVFVFVAIAYSVVFSEAPNIFHEKKTVGLIAAVSLAFVMGLADDAYNTRPYLKLGIQILCGIVLVLTGSQIHMFHHDVLDAITTVIWVVLIMNSLNMLDNMDGITGTTVAFILITTIASSWMLLGFNTNLETIFMISVLGAVIGFLTMNIHPSKLFMGDAGSQFIGLFVAYFGMEYLWNIGTLNPDSIHPSWIGICVTLIAFTPAAVDTLTVVINRLRRGQSPMVGGKDHTTHHLVYAGLSDFKVWLVFLAIGLISCLLAMAIINMTVLKTYSPIVFFLSYFIFVFVILYRNTIKYQGPDK